MRIENGGYNLEAEIKRAAALISLGGMLVACGEGYSYTPTTVENIGPDPNLSCPGDFDVNKGVAVNSDFEYLALGTTGLTVEVGDDYMTEFNNGQLRLLREVKGKGKLGDVVGWAFTDKEGHVKNGSIHTTGDSEAICEDK